jgi:probable rRNA maturation factor
LRKSNSHIHVFNKQKKVLVDTRRLEEFLGRLAHRLGVKAEFSTVLVSDRGIRYYNRRYRRVPEPTDVLAFPMGEESYLGDILISVETAGRQRRKSLQTELKVLALHGLLHLMGYDHEIDSGEMESMEVQLRREFQLL